MTAFRPLVLAACLSVPLSLQAAASAEANCKAFKDAVEDRADLTKDEKDEWLASPNIWRGFIWENDGFAQGGDRHYTNGMKLSWLYNPCRGKLQFLEALWRRVQKQDPGEVNSFHTGGAFGMNMYTPTNIRADVRQRFDRPYVGWLYGGLQVQVQRSPGELVKRGWGTGLDALEIQVGVIGPIAGQGPLQEWWHLDVGMSKKVPHWDFQVPDRLGVNAVYTKSRHYWMSRSLRGTVFGGGALGNVISYVNAGAVLAFGNPGEGFIASTTIQPAAPPAVPARLKNESTDERSARLAARKPARLGDREWSVFVGMDHRYIGNSIFIEGRGDAQHDITLVRHVYDLFAGFTVQFWKSHAFTYKHIRRSVEFRSDEPSVVQPHTLGQFVYELRF